MQCDQCGHDTLPQAAYCHWCGHQIQLRCQSCDAVNPVGSSFCHGCGASLGVHTETTSQEASPHEPVAHYAPLAVQCPRCAATNEPGATFCFRCGFPMEEAGTPGVNFPHIPAYRDGVPAGFWIRLVAYFIDGFVLLVGLLILLAASGRAYFESTEVFSVVDLVGIGINLTYYTLIVSAWGTTLGKRPFDMYVVRTDGSRVGPGRALARALAYYVSTFILLIGFIMIGLRKDKRGLHDLICDTVVVIKKRPPYSNMT